MVGGVYELHLTAWRYVANNAATVIVIQLEIRHNI